MSETAIVGIGYVEVGEHWDTGLRELGAYAGQAALNDSNVRRPDALFLANAYGSTFNHQSQAAALIADVLGLSGIEAYTIEAGDASGGAAIRAAHLAVLSGQVNAALVIGVEKTTDVVGSERVRSRTTSLDVELETFHGATLTSMSALLMRRYMHTYGVDLSAFEKFSVNAHANGSLASHAMYRNRLREGAFAKAPMIADPVSLFDSAPDADGAAAVVIARADTAGDLTSHPVRITGSSVTTGRMTLQDRDDVLHLSAVKQGVDRVLEQSQLSRDDIDFFELHDAYTVFSALSLESAGFVERGKGWDVADLIGRDGKLPISTFGGMKSRGNPAGAAGVYQAVEAVMQLRGEAGDNQVEGATAGMIQNLGGVATTAVTHILQR